jgi:nucleoside-diphosphate-sugar epimerase
MDIIAGKVFIVTGGASGLGEGTARMLAANGGKVVIADMQVERGEAVAKRDRRRFVKCDVSQEADGQAVVAKPRLAGQADGPGQLRRHRAGGEDRGQGRRPQRWRCSPRPSPSTWSAAST